MGEIRIAVLLVISLLLSGCTQLLDESESSTEKEGDLNDKKPLSLSLHTYDQQGVLGDILRAEGILNASDYSRVELTAEFLLDGVFKEQEYRINSADERFWILWEVDEPGEWTVNIIAEEELQSVNIVWQVDIAAPEEQNVILSADTLIELAAPRPYVIRGQLIHSYPESCTVSSETYDAVVSSDSTWEIPLGIVEENIIVELTAECGVWTTSYDSRTVQITIAEGNDADGDGIDNDVDNCPDGYGEEQGWVSNTISDGDGDGCHDDEEDLDDDGDGIADLRDNCHDSPGWISTLANDGDQDGCHDADDDDDDDGDGILDVDDACSPGVMNWSSNLYNDWDSDGCRDADEDDDDDDDGAEDEVDSCVRGEQSWLRNTSTDFDDDGCRDSSEDEDDDNDGVNDVNGSGAELDRCKFTPADAEDVDEFGCAAIERDSDGDGVNDSEDLCEGTPLSLVVNAVGCADNDGDGVFSNVDSCPTSPTRWTVDEQGCMVVEKPVEWKTSGYGTGRYGTVANFNIATLSGSWSFQGSWTGMDMHLFLFKYTDSSGNTNSGQWSSNPAAMIRKLPTNTHLFYGSYDNSYHQDVIDQKARVVSGLNNAEEEQWMSNIHFVDQRAGSISGGLGGLISNWGDLYYGIDRFQRGREIGSINDWINSGSDSTHWAYEAKTWDYEFKQEIRLSDPGIDAVTISPGDWHSGGWSAGYSSFWNATIDLPNNLEEYDTLEIFHEHTCEDRRDIYVDSNGDKKGCHEWDYLAYLKLCESVDSNSCGREVARWITTYGREGRWLTDISPYLFMLENDEEMRFKYEGANRGGMTIKLLFSNWGEGKQAFSGIKLFGGGNFDGSYNNESKYKRQENFTVPAEATAVRIVATITGHGFGQDTANCAEFCDHEHHYYVGGNHAFEWHPIVHDNQGCENDIANGVIANQFGSWPYGRAGWCAGQNVEQWTYDITSWLDMSGGNNHITYKGLFNGQEYQPTDTNGGERKIRADIWVVFYQDMP
jgi:hypothetical protein